MVEDLDQRPASGTSYYQVWPLIFKIEGHARFPSVWVSLLSGLGKSSWVNKILRRAHCVRLLRMTNGGLSMRCFDSSREAGLRMTAGVLDSMRHFDCAAFGSFAQCDK